MTQGIKRMYRTVTYSNEIRIVQVTRETATSVWTISNGVNKERVYRKQTNGHQYWDTWQQAHDHLVNLARKRLQEAERQVSRRRTEYTELLQRREFDESGAPS